MNRTLIRNIGQLATPTGRAAKRGPDQGEIVLLENGFTALAKPGGARFDACARGQLLLLAPWEHHTDKRVITRLQCTMLNNMAAALCNGERL